MGKTLGEYKNVLTAVRNQFADRDARARRGLNDLRTTIHVVTGIEAAMLDLLGQHGRQRRFAGRRRSAWRSEIEMLGYLFFVGVAGLRRCRIRASRMSNATGIVCAMKRR